MEPTLVELKTELANVKAMLGDPPAIKTVDVNDKLAATVKSAADVKLEANFGFDNFGGFVKEVRECRLQGVMSPKMGKAQNIFNATVGMNEKFGSDGGYLVPPEYSRKLFERMYDPNGLLGMTDSYPISGNTITFPRNNETSRANGSRWGGVRAYWVKEGDAGTASKPGFGTLGLTLHKLMCLAGMTDELMSDSAMAAESYLMRVFSDEMTFVAGDAIINGTGAGQPMGILNAPCTVSVSKETGQVAATINTQNIVKMWSRMFSGCRSNAVWFANQDIEPQLNTMTLGVGTAGVTTYMPPGGLSGKPYGTLMGRPVVPIEFAATCGTVGDLILADLRQYITVNKGMQAASSMHLYFDSDQMCFRMTFRLDGQPWWATALTPYKGTATQSCFITLATRA